MHGQFELTPLCNFSCKMCYVHLNPDQLDGRAVLSVEQWKDLMRQAWEAGMINATLTGGECLAYPGFDEIYSYLCSLGCQVVLLTNGYLLNEERVQFLLRNPPKKIRITLYGCNDDVYERVTGRRAFSRVIQNIRRAKDAGLRISLAVTPNTFLGEDALETVRIGKTLDPNLSVNADLFAPREETGRSGLPCGHDAELYVKIHRLICEMDGVALKSVDESKLPPIGGPEHESAAKGLLCGGGRSSFVIDWKGNLMPCNRLNMISFSALNEGFKAAWAQVNRCAKEWPRVPECKGCAYERICKRCPASMLMYAPAGKQPIQLCERTRYYAMNGIGPVPECE